MRGRVVGQACEADGLGGDLFAEARDLYANLWQSGSGLPGDFADLSIAPDGSRMAVTAFVSVAADRDPEPRLALVDVDSGLLELRPGRARAPAYAPDGRRLAYLEDSAGSADARLQVETLATGATQSMELTPGEVEVMRWSPDSRALLLGIAPPGADRGSAQGGGTIAGAGAKARDWRPDVRSSGEAEAPRRLWIVRPGEGLRALPCESNVWDACWLGEQRIAAITSAKAGEAGWYDAVLEGFCAQSGRGQILYRPETQLGGLASTPSGRRLAVIEGLASDRGLVAGDVQLLDSGRIERIDTHAIDVTFLGWWTERDLFCLGIRGPDTVAGHYDAEDRRFEEIWTSRDLTTCGRYPSAVPTGPPGDFAFIAEGFETTPQLALVEQGRCKVVHRLKDHARPQQAAGQAIAWQGRDGTPLSGWLLEPGTARPHPTVMAVHGGPVWQWRPFWMARPRGLPLRMLLERGFAIFLPNPRGSGGGGQALAGGVIGDTGGADAEDLLSGLDHLVEEGLADPQRLGVTGVSYGGFLSAWLVTRDHRFKAAVPVAPATNRVSQYLTANHPRFLDLFLAGRFDDPASDFTRRSPVFHAAKARTPTLLVCGALDRCTPPGEALQFHRALATAGVPTTLVTYPLEAHGIHHVPALFDLCARMASWFEQYLKPERPCR